MYEFDSVSVSAFEAAELAATLTAKSAEGWDVAAVVTAGSDVVAYLRRATGEDAAKEDDTVETSVPESTITGHEPAGTAAESVGAASTASDLLAGGSSSAATSSDSGGTGWGSGGDSQPSGGWGTGSSTTSWGGSAQQTSAPAAQSQTPAVPAGWYADPAGRFELRYWDGGAWTEHVSRAGQQYTDPPVA
jgi:hypothetical protein